MAARHDLIGKCGTTWEEIFWDGIPEVIPCKCGTPTCTAKISFAWGGMRRAAEQSISVVYFENPKTGQRMVAGSTHARPPQGWVRRETTTYRETQLLEKSLQNQDYELSARSREQIQAMSELQESYERSVWRQEVDQLEAHARRERNNRIEAELEEFGASTYVPKIQDDAARARLAKDLAKQASEQLYKQQTDRWKPIDTGVHLGALHYDECSK